MFDIIIVLLISTMIFLLLSMTFSVNSLLKLISNDN